MINNIDSSYNTKFNIKNTRFINFKTNFATLKTSNDTFISNNKETKDSKSKWAMICAGITALVLIAAGIVISKKKINARKLEQTKRQAEKIEKEAEKILNTETTDVKNTKQQVEILQTKNKQKSQKPPIYTGLTAVEERPSILEGCKEYDKRILYKNSKGKVMKEVQIIEDKPYKTILYNADGTITRRTIYDLKTGDIKNIYLYNKKGSLKGQIFIDQYGLIHYKDTIFAGYKNKDIPELLKLIPEFNKYDKLSEKELIEELISELNKGNSVDAKFKIDYLSKRISTKNAEIIVPNRCHRPKEGDNINAYLLGKNISPKIEYLERLKKCIQDNDATFAKNLATDRAAVRYRGEHYDSENIDRYNEYLNLKEGDTFENIGYTWYSNNPTVFSGYGNASKDKTIKGVRHIIEIPEKSTHIEEAFGGTGGIEGTIDRNAKFQCLRKTVDKDGNITIVSRYISP